MGWVRWPAAVESQKGGEPEGRRARREESQGELLAPNACGWGKNSHVSNASCRYCRQPRSVMDGTGMLSGGSGKPEGREARGGLPKEGFPRVQRRVGELPTAKKHSEQERRINGLMEGKPEGGKQGRFAEGGFPTDTALRYLAASTLSNAPSKEAFCIWKHPALYAWPGEITDISW